MINCKDVRVQFCEIPTYIVIISLKVRLIANTEHKRKKAMKILHSLTEADVLTRSIFIKLPNPEEPSDHIIGEVLLYMF